jgi:hypothetical protein
LGARRDTKPVGGFLAAHGLDPLYNCPHIFPRPHRGEGTEKQAQDKGEILSHAMAFFPLGLVAAQLDARL